MPNCAADRLIAALDREIRERGYGSISAMERALGQSVGWWKHRVDSGRLNLHQALSVLDYLGLDPIRFLRQHLEREGRLELHRPPGPEPEIVERARRRLTEGEEGSGVGEVFLRSLDRQRYEEPEEVLGFLESSAKLVEPELVPLLLGVAGSTFRMLLRHDEGEHCLLGAIEISQERGQPGWEAESLQRLANIYSNRLDNQTALRLSEQALLLQMRIGDQAGVARALVNQGVWLSRLQQNQASIEVMKEALRRLPESEQRYRSVAHQVLGLKYREQGDLEQALGELIRAASFAENLSSVDVAKILWLRAEVQEDLGFLAAAESDLCEALRRLLPKHPVDAALVHLGLVRLKLLQENPDEALAASKSLLALLEPLRSKKEISSAIGDVLRESEKGLTLALVEQTQKQIQHERQKLIGPAARSLS